MLRSVFLLALVVAVLGWAPAATAARRALLVGINTYDHLSAQAQLERAVNDARSVGDALGSIGFDVLIGENLTRPQFNALWQTFLDRIQPNDTVVLFFSGHGIEIDGQNFLLPRDIPGVRTGRQEQLRRESLSVSEFLLDLRAKRTQVSIVILDACRNSPFQSPEARALGVGTGLAGIKDPPEGTFIMYSAGSGELALDRLPGADPDLHNSIYTRKLLPLLKTPGLSLPEMAQQLRAEVREIAATAHHVQRPAYYDGLIGRFCLTTCEKPPPATVVDTFAHDKADESAWATAVAAGNLAAFRIYLALHPGGRNVANARARIEELEQSEREIAANRQTEQARLAQLAELRRLAEEEDAKRRAAAERGREEAASWMRAVAVNRAAEYRRHINEWPQGRYVDDARQRIERLTRLEEQWGNMVTSRNLARLEAFAIEAAESEFGPLAALRLNELRAQEAKHWQAANETGTLAELVRFLASWEEGFFAAQAREKVASLRSIQKEWNALSESDDEKQLERFVSRHGWSEFGAAAVARLVALRRERASPEGEHLRSLNADRMLSEIDRAVVRFVSTGETIEFDSIAMPRYRTALGRSFLQTMMKGQTVTGEGAFAATAASHGTTERIDGLGVIIKNSANGRGSLFLLQIYISDRTRRDVEQRDRRFMTMEIEADVFGFVCIATRWHTLAANTNPEKRSERCVIERKQLGR